MQRMLWLTLRASHYKDAARCRCTRAFAGNQDFHRSRFCARPIHKVHDSSSASLVEPCGYFCASDAGNIHPRPLFPLATFANHFTSITAAPSCPAIPPASSARPLCLSSQTWSRFSANGGEGICFSPRDRLRDLVVLCFCGTGVPPRFRCGISLGGRAACSALVYNHLFFKEIEIIVATGFDTAIQGKRGTMAPLGATRSSIFSLVCEHNHVS